MSLKKFIINDETLVVILASSIGLAGFFATSTLSSGELFYPLIHLLSTLAGLGLFYYFSSRTPQQLSVMAIPLFTAITVACLVTLSADMDVGWGARRNLPYTANTIMPAELFALAIPLLLFRYATAKYKRTGLIILTSIVLPLYLVFLMPHLRIILMVFITSTLCLMLFRASRLAGVIIFLSGIAGTALIFVSMPYRWNRLLMLFTPEKDPNGSGWENLTIERAINSSGISGIDWSVVRAIPDEPIHWLHAESLLKSQTMGYVGIDYGFLGMMIITALFTALIIVALRKSFSIKQTNLRIIALVTLIPSVIYLATNSMLMVNGVYSFGNPLPILSFNPALTISTLGIIGLIFSLSKIEDFSNQDYSKSRLDILIDTLYQHSFGRIINSLATEKSKIIDQQQSQIEQLNLELEVVVAERDRLQTAVHNEDVVHE